MGTRIDQIDRSSKNGQEAAHAARELMARSLHTGRVDLALERALQHCCDGARGDRSPAELAIALRCLLDAAFLSLPADRQRAGDGPYEAIAELIVRLAGLGDGPDGDEDGRPRGLRESEILHIRSGARRPRATLSDEASSSAELHRRFVEVLNARRTTALEAGLVRTREPVDPAPLGALRRAAAEHAAGLRRAGVPAEQVVITVRETLAHGVPEVWGGERETLVSEIVRWSISAYYAP